MQYFYFNFVIIYDNTLITTIKSIQNISSVEMKDCGDSFVFIGLSFYIIMKLIKLTEENKLEIFSKYETGNYTETAIAIEYGVHKCTINRLLRKHNYPRKSPSEIHRKYPIDETFFDNIDTQEKAYFLGFLYADGYNNTPNNLIRLTLKETDKEILVKLNSLLQPTKPLRYLHTKDDNSWATSNQYSLQIHNKHISNRLAELGCGRAKTFTLEFPNTQQVPLQFLPHFLRGYNDGDGCIHKKAVVTLMSTANFCNSLACFLKDNFNVYYSVYRRKGGIYEIRLCGDSAKSFLNWIYKDSSIHLERKYQRYLDMISRIDKRFK